MEKRPINFMVRTYVRFIKLKGLSYHESITSIKSHLNMPKGSQNCLFCDSARHTTIHCTSSMNGNYKKLIDIKTIECPDFQSYTLKELKVIAYTNPYEKSLDGSLGMGNNRLNRKNGRNPIPLTLSKNRMVKVLKKDGKFVALL